MDLLISPYLVQKYINVSSTGRLAKSQDDIILSSIFENKNNRFILNQKLLDFYEGLFAPNSNELDIFQQQFVELINERGISKASNKSSLKDVLLETQDNYLNEKNDLEIYMNLSVDDSDSCEGKFSGYFSKMSTERLRHFLYFNLAANNPNPLTYWYYDFNSNDEIKLFLNNIYELYTGGEIDIFDAYLNIGHSYYDFFLHQANKINYYTAFMPARKIVEKIDANRGLIDYFKKVFIFRAHHSTYLHERRIKFNNISIEINNDFANVLIAEPTWKIDVYVCNRIVGEINRKKQFFSRDLDK